MQKIYKSEIIAEILDKRGHSVPDIHYESECIDKWINDAKGSYPKLNDYESEWLDYFNNHGIGEFPYETFTGTSGTIDNVVPYEYKSAILTGQTLMNISMINKFSLTNGNSNVRTYGKMIYGKKYLQIIAITKNTMTNSNNDVAQINAYEYNSNHNFDVEDNIASGFIGVKKLIGMASRNGKRHDTSIRTYSNSVGVLEGYEILIEYHEGMENWDIPYFEGMQSVKMPVLTTTGKNLFDITKRTDGKFISSSGVLSVALTNILSDFIKVNSNQNYYGYSEGYSSNLQVSWYDKEKNFIMRETTSNRIVTSPSNAKYCRVHNQYYELDNDGLDFSNAKIMFSSVNADYEPYQSIILTVNEDVTLRGIGDVKDELNLLTGEISNNFNKITIDGTENWYKTSNETELTVRYRCDNIGVSILKENICICDSYNVGVNTSGDDLVVAFSGTMLTYRVLKSKFPTLEDFKKWLNDNPHTFIYQTEKSIKTVDLTIKDQDNKPVKLKPIEGTMHIQTSGNPINPVLNCEVPVEAITQNLASFTEE